MKEIILLIMLLAICACETVNKTCPVGENMEIYMPEAYCPPERYVLRTKDFYTLLCCEDKTPCLNTGMISHFASSGECPNVIYSGYESHPIERHAYQYKTNGREFLCPVPVGYLWLIISRSQTKMEIKKENLPVGLKDMEDLDHRLKICEKHGDCGEGEFCGDVINESLEFRGQCDGTSDTCIEDSECVEDKCLLNKELWTWADKTHMFCYKVPLNTDKPYEQQYAMRSFTKNLAVCNKDSDCDSQHIQGAHCGMYTQFYWTEYVADSDPTKIGVQKVGKGLCMEAKPIAFIFTLLFQKLEPLESDQIFLPVDMNHNDYFYMEKLKQCEMNANCTQGQFCGERLRKLAGDVSMGKDRKYCYAVPGRNSSDVEYVVVPDRTGLLVCDNSEDCEIGMCYIEDDSQFMGVSQNGTNKVYNGLCIKANPGSSFTIIWIFVIVVFIIMSVIGLVVFLVLRKSATSEKPKKEKMTSEKPSERTDREGPSSNTERNGTGTIRSQKENV